MIFYDTETCGLHGVAVLIQYAYDDGPIQLHSVWMEPIHSTLNLIKNMMEHEGGVVGFNLAFDHFHLCKLYTMFSLWHDHDAIPYDIINELAEFEMQARDGFCLKPVTCCDLMLYARKGPYQSTMDRSDIRIKKIPTVLAWQLADELEKRIQLKDIYFARRKNKLASKWSILDRHDSDDNLDPDFKDIVLKFAPSSALKALAIDALNLPVEEVLTFGDTEVDSTWFPEEFGYAPFAKALGGNHNNWKGAWPEKVQHHISHWTYNERARRYASDDVKYTRALYHHFGDPVLGDDDSVLACMVAAARWKGYKINIPKLQELRNNAAKRIVNTPTAPRQVRFYISKVFDETENLAFKGSTKKIVLEDISKFTRPCQQCNKSANIELVQEKVNEELVNEFDAPELILNTVIKQSEISKYCSACKGSGVEPHPAAIRAKEVLAARAAAKEIELYDKLLLAGRFHASLKVIGTLSSRMAGADGLNPQGINKSKDVRSCFPLAFDDNDLCGGDYEGFEVTLAEACYNDPDLRKDLLTCELCAGQMQRVNEKIKASSFLSNEAFNKYLSRKELIDAVNDTFENDFICTQCGSNKGKKIHALFGVHVYPDMTYEQIIATAKTNDDRYTRCKSAVFAMLYGGEGPTLRERLGVDLETANKAFEQFLRKYKRVGIERRKIFDMFCSMRQPNGIGTKVEWHQPSDYIESMFGFKRYFTLENKICRVLFELANTPPKTWRDIKVKVQRRDRVQTVGGAVQSALYASAFALQAGNMRAAANHVIQSSGAQITKKTQRVIWDVQPSGFNPWLVQPLNVHDELMVPCHPNIKTKVKDVVKNCVESFRDKIPLIKIDWSLDLKSWADK